MAKRNRKKKESRAAAIRWPAYVLPLFLFLVQIVRLPGAESQYRLPKMALAVSALALVAGIGFASRLQRRGVTLPGGPLAWALLAFPALQSLSCLWGAVPARALEAAIVSAVWVVGVLWISTLDAADQGRALRWTVAGACVSAGVSLIQATGVPLWTVSSDSTLDRFRLIGLTGNPADMAISASLLLALILSDPSWKLSSWKGWFAPGLLVLVTLIGQTLTAYLAIAAVAIVWLARRSLRLLWVPAAAGALVVVVVVLFGAPTERLQRLQRRIEQGNWYAFLSARADGWTAAAQMIREHPVLGVGAGHFTHAYYPSRLAWLEAHDDTGGRGETATHFAWAHNDPLQLVAELGILGAVWMIAFATICVRYRPRGDPLPLLAGAALIPLAIFHYPSHVAVGLVPLSLILARLLQADEEPITVAPESRAVKVAVAFVLIICSLSVMLWQMKITALNAWRGGMEAVLASATSASEAQRMQIGGMVERQTATRLQQSPGSAAWMLRLVGRARLARGDSAAAEIAFRSAYELWPHEEADFGLGLALADQGRRNQAMLHLARVCRTNPALTKMIPDRDLRRAVRILIREQSKR
jgi:O-antigen ligase